MSEHVDPVYNEGSYSDEDLVYSRRVRCQCGAGLAYPVSAPPSGYWDCSDILTGRAIPMGQTGWTRHTDRLPFSVYEIRPEDVEHTRTKRENPFR